MVWKQSKKGLLYNRCALSIHQFGLCIYEEIANGTYKNVWYDPIDNISYCVAEPLRPRLFAWIARSRQSNELECHVVLCKTRRQACFLAELLAQTFFEAYHYRQQRIHEFTPKLSTHCSVCDTIHRQHQPHHHLNDTSIDQKPTNEDYERISFHEPMIARAYVHGYEGQSMNSTSRRSFDYDTTFNDEDSFKPSEYYRRNVFYKE